MKGLLEEIHEIPARAQDCLRVHASLKLPTGVPYVGMGSSYYAPLVLYYAGADILPQIASEYYYYLGKRKAPLGVLISQSGESSETVWCLEKFSKTTVVSSAKDSTLGVAAGTFVDLAIGKEEFLSSTKSFVNTLVVLYKGLGIDPRVAVEELGKQFEKYEAKAKEDAKKVAAYMSSRAVAGLYVIGSGPNFGAACQGALTLSEVTKRCWVGMPVAQFDHGPKETSDDAVVLTLNSGGSDSKRLGGLVTLLSDKTNACVIQLEEHTVGELLSPLPFIVRLNFFMNYLADALAVGETFALGGKVTTVKASLK